MQGQAPPRRLVEDPVAQDGGIAEQRGQRHVQPHCRRPARRRPPGHPAPGGRHTQPGLLPLSGPIPLSVPLPLDGHADHGQHHAGGEPVEVLQQRVVEHRVRAGEIGGAQRQRGDRQHRRDDQLQSQAPGTVSASAEPSHGRRVDRQERVEGDLDAQGPGGEDSAVERAAAVDLQEQVVAPPVVGEDPTEVGPPGEHGESQPVGGDDAQQAPPGVGPQARPPGAEDLRRQQRPVQQEAGDDEEDRHPDREVAEQRGRPGVGREATEDGGVGDDDAQRGHRPQRVDEREARVARGRRDDRWRWVGALRLSRGSRHAGGCQ